MRRGDLGQVPELSTEHLDALCEQLAAAETGADQFAALVGCIDTAKAEQGIEGGPELMQRGPGNSEAVRRLARRYRAQRAREAAHAVGLAASRPTARRTRRLGRWQPRARAAPRTTPAAARP